MKKRKNTMLLFSIPRHDEMDRLNKEAYGTRSRLKGKQLSIYEPFKF
jgi:hypothetical protein